MTGTEFAAAGERLALAHAAIRPDAAAWRADDPAAADELAEWELEGHPFTNWPPACGTDPGEADMTEIKTVADVLDGLLALYANPDTWCREGIARDAAGHEVPAHSPEAVAWSLEGALERVIGDWEGTRPVRAALCDGRAGLRS